MLKRYSHFVAYLLLALLPMQALATANMLICNSMMQANSVEKSVVKDSAELALSEMPCHQTIKNEAIQNVVSDSSHDKSHQQNSHQPSSHKSSCASVCANMCALTAMPANIQSTFALNFTQTFDINHQSYASITLPNLQRPPIAFI